ncbi:DUF6708 domain-containing protein [Chromobacterium haemolyticum]|uniref:DUF6708 domain-containing protein n=1 Tax=Chromobacterium haemolyticum TaxID=394935 RepID=UPI001131B397|nr:DUF6708 domain-containing protein [Chromobacterium haemolyticum]
MERRNNHHLHPAFARHFYIFTLLLITAHGAIFTYPDEPEAWALLLFGMAITSPLIWLLFKSIRKEINYTHYPIRLDRNNNKIHVFRQNGSTLSADWNAIFFTLSKVTGNHWEIQGHILKPDNISIIETFSFCSLEVGEEGRKACYLYWEFLRRYMEEGPQSVVNEIKAILPISPQKHNFTWMVNGFIFTFGNNGLGLLTTLVYIIITTPGRWLAMRYSKIPHWPKEIEEQSPIQPNDPYFRDATSNPK